MNNVADLVGIGSNVATKSLNAANPVNVLQNTAKTLDTIDDTIRNIKPADVVKTATNTLNNIADKSVSKTISNINKQYSRTSSTANTVLDLAEAGYNKLMNDLYGPGSGNLDLPNIPQFSIENMSAADLLALLAAEAKATVSKAGEKTYDDTIAGIKGLMEFTNRNSGKIGNQNKIGSTIPASSNSAAESKALTKGVVKDVKKAAKDLDKFSKRNVGKIGNQNKIGSKKK